ncbi:hypothetical protein Taro_010256 [Colocasia esculenta]|uniref:Uncharacterized protein n=1 Tax=Colocasia esculenta TaxID=4460 RepID=A0A843U770_COLES|nr:hypothetical protein [Colocasia esculenta]
MVQGGWRIVGRVALPNHARKRRGAVQFSWELVQGSVRTERLREVLACSENRFRVSVGVVAEELGVNIDCRQVHQPGYRRPDPLPSTSCKRQSMWPPTCI